MTTQSNLGAELFRGLIILTTAGALGLAAYLYAFMHVSLGLVTQLEIVLASIWLSVLGAIPLILSIVRIEEKERGRPRRNETASLWRNGYNQAHYDLGARLGMHDAERGNPMIADEDFASPQMRGGYVAGRQYVLYQHGTIDESDHVGDITSQNVRDVEAACNRLFNADLALERLLRPGDE